MLPTTRSPFGEFMRPSGSPRKFLSRRITWDWTASVQHFSGAPRRNCVILSARPIATERPGWDFDYEALWQFGTFGAANIRAWTVASETGYRLPTAVLKPRFSAKVDISSGDHPKSDPTILGTFDPLFPKGNYFGVLA